MKNFNWSNIINGFRGFEELAYEYVACEYETLQGNWIHTKATRDGNKDAFSLVCGFRPDDLSAEEWWMEAKYSNKNERITRYRLDSTIVSAAIHGNVSKIIFVTNISIATKTIMDIRIALKQAINCSEVHFCSRSTLEYWLLLHPEIFEKYFPKNNITTLSLESLFIGEPLELYSELQQGQIFSEPTKTLQVGIDYFAYFSVFSKEKKNLPLKINENYSGIEIKSNENICLSEGMNQCVIKIGITPQFNMLYELPDGRTIEEKKYLDGAPLKLGEIDILIKKPIDVLETCQEKLNIPTQNEIIEKLRWSLLNMHNCRNSSINFIFGKSGLGKTYLIERFKRNFITAEQLVFSLSFSNNSIANDLNIYRLISFCLFPYLPPDTIDIEYLNRTSGSIYLTKFFWEVVKLKDNPDKLHDLYKYTTVGEIFPPQIKLNTRIILIDDLQKLNHASLRFLFVILTELIEKQQSLFVVMNSWPEMENVQEYFDFTSKVYTEKYRLTLSKIDLIKAIEQTESLGFSLDIEIFDLIFPNIVELLTFIRQNKKEVFQSLDDFLIACRLFIGSSLAKETILEKFNKIFATNPKAKEICSKIYWSIDGIAPHEPLSKIEYTLLSHQLIKFSDVGKLVPFHDLYQLYYKERFSRPFNAIHTDENNNDNIYDKIVNTLAMTFNPTALSEIVELLFKWKAEGRFYSILYILENLFEQNDKQLLRNRIGDSNYFKLYFLYAFGVANSSKTTSGKTIFQQIEKETKNISNKDVLLIRLQTLFEIINSNYEWLQHKEALVAIQEIKALIDSLQKLHILSEDINCCDVYILIRQIEILILSEQNKENASISFNELEEITRKYSYHYEQAFFRIRYAQTLYFRDTKTAMALLGQSKVELLERYSTTDKFYLWAQIDEIFLKIITNQDAYCIEELKVLHQSLKKNYYNDYRKKIFAFSNIYYAVGLIQLGNNYLFSDTITLRDLRPRQKAFYYESLALHHAINGKIADALLNLKKAQDLFANFPSYLKIIKHNQKLLENNEFNKKLIWFAYNNTCPKGQYCIDPRCIW